MSDHLSSPRVLRDPVIDLTDLYFFPVPDMPGRLARRPGPRTSGLRRLELPRLLAAGRSNQRIALDLAVVAPSGDRSAHRDIPPGRLLWVTRSGDLNPYCSPKSRAARAGLSATGPHEMGG